MTVLAFLILRGKLGHVRITPPSPGNPVSFGAETRFTSFITPELRAGDPLFPAKLNYTHAYMVKLKRSFLFFFLKETLYNIVQYCAKCLMRDTSEPEIPAEVTATMAQ